MISSYQTEEQDPLESPVRSSRRVAPYFEPEQEAALLNRKELPAIPLGELPSG
jgi:hypothetical protein